MATTAVANLSAYAVQVGLLLAVGLLLPRLLKLRDPAVGLRYWQLLLAVILLLPVLQPWRVVHPARAISFGGTLTEAVASRVPAQNSALPWGQILLAGLGAVAAARVLWILAGLVRLRAVRREATALSPLPQEMESLRHRLASAEFFVSDAVGAPLTFGWRKPVVLVPQGFQSLPRTVQACVACHELLHVKRRDWLAVLVEEIGRAVLWFHPAVWVLLRRAALCREQVVDREAVKVMGDRRSYLEALEKMAVMRSPARTDPALLFLGRHSLVERVSLLAKEVRMSKSRILTSAATLAVLLAVTAFLGGVVFPMVSGKSNGSVFPALMAQGKAPSPKVYKMGDKSIVPPKLIKQVGVEYPEDARKAGKEGEVVLSIIVDENGNVREPEVVKSSEPVFVQTAKDAVLQWKFQPATRKGTAVAAQWIVTIHFNADKEAPKK